MEILNSVKILAERLMTHPEEFERGNKFDAIKEAIQDLAEGKNSALWYLNAEEKDMLVLALREVKRKKFEDNVLLQILDETEEKRIGPASVKSGFRKAQIKAEGQAVGYGA